MHGAALRSSVAVTVSPLRLMSTSTVPELAGEVLLGGVTALAATPPSG